MLAFIAEIGADPVYPMIELIVPDYNSPIPTTNLYTWTQPPSLDSMRDGDFSSSLAYANDGTMFTAFYSVVVQ